jgi:integrase/recombinase XerD
MTRGFSSILASDMDHFLVFKRALGHPYQRGELMLRSFDRYVAQYGSRQARVPLEELIEGWLARREGCKPVTTANELGVLRQLCLFRRRRDTRAFVPARSWAPQSTQSHFLPYIFSPAEIRAMLHGTRRIRGPAFRGLAIRTLLLILYCTGLRFGEAVRLRLTDVDLAEGLFWVRESKGKTRLVPFRRDLQRELRVYLKERERIAGSAPNRALFVQPDGRPYLRRTASETVCRLLRRLGIKPPRGRVGPRPYDLRHTFAVHRLTRWYREGAAIETQLPFLSAYMGHDNLLGTEVYLRATPDLMAIAARRFEARFQPAGPRS